jgi:hypothetical protein
MVGTDVLNELQRLQGKVKRNWETLQRNGVLRDSQTCRNLMEARIVLGFGARTELPP